MNPLAANVSLLLQLLALSDRPKDNNVMPGFQAPMSGFKLQSTWNPPDHGCRFDVYENDDCTKTNDDDEQTVPETKMIWSRPKRNGLRCRKWLWPDGYVPYESRLNDKSIEEKFLAAVDEMNSLGCVRFSPRKSDEGYGKFLLVEETTPIVGRSCAATAGTTAAQPRVYLSTACSKGKILHELMHVLGFAHEHQRPDRDSYVRINCENVMENVTQDFRKLKHGVTDVFDQPYDFNSIMHYRIDHFSKNGRPTIVPLDSKVDIDKIGLMESLSQSDVIKVKRMYCPE